MKIGRHCIQVILHKWYYIIIFYPLYFIFMECFDPGWKCWSISVLSYLQVSSRYNRPAVQMSTCLSLVHGYIFLLYVYLIKTCVGKYAKIYLRHLFQGYFQNVTASSTGGSSWLYFFVFSVICYLYCFMFVWRYYSFLLGFLRSVALVDKHLCALQCQGFERTWQCLDRCLHILV